MGSNTKTESIHIYIAAKSLLMAADTCQSEIKKASLTAAALAVSEMLMVKGGALEQVIPNPDRSNTFLPTSR